MTACEKLNKRFSIETETQQLHFKPGEGDIPVVEIFNAQASAVISLQGAHLLRWKPGNEDEVIWVSTDAIFKTGKSVRGGIPVCWPWFGAHESEPDFTPHGFARMVMWQVTETAALNDGTTRICFRLNPEECGERERLMWPHKTVLDYELIIGRELKLNLTTSNRDNHVVKISQALHTYFQVADASAVQLHGLDGREYLDKTEGFLRKQQQGVVTISEEVDRVYLGTADELRLEDRDREIVISKQGSHSTVVWNPWQQVAEKMGDLGEKGYLAMLCVETANAAEDAVMLEPEQAHTLSVCYRVTHK